jgi:hypothetical protein
MHWQNISLAETQQVSVHLSNVKGAFKHKQHSLGVGEERSAGCGDWCAVLFVTMGEVGLLAWKACTGKVQLAFLQSTTGAVGSSCEPMPCCREGGGILWHGGFGWHATHCVAKYLYASARDKMAITPIASMIVPGPLVWCCIYSPLPWAPPPPLPPRVQAAKWP